MCGATVITLSVVVPLPVTEGGEKEQEANSGRPLHEVGEKVTVPLYPACPVTLSVKLPEAPGLVMTMTGLLTLKARRKGATATVTAGEVELV